MPHVGLTLAVQHAQVLLRVHFDSVISSGISTQAELPVVLNGNDKLITGRVVRLNDLNRPVVDVVFVSGMDEVLGSHLILVNRISTSYGLSILPASSWNQAVEVGFHGEIEIAILARHCHLILSQFAIVILFVVPGITVSFTISVVSHLEVSKASEEISAVHEEDAIVLGRGWVDAVGNLGLVICSPSGIALVPRLVEVRYAPWVAKHVHLVVNR